MPKPKTNPGGASDRKRRGMRTLVTPISEELHAMAHLTAGTYAGRDRAVSRVVAAALEAFCRARLKECGIDPEKIPKKSLK